MSENIITTEAFFDDKLNRKEIAENFRKILLETNLNVYSVSAPWGGGKTYFIENLIKLFKDEAVCILYNAWESDFYDLPLIPLLVELLDKIETLSNYTELENDINWSKKFAKEFCEKTSFNIGFNTGIFNCSANFNANKKMKDSDYKTLKDSIREFKAKLEDITNKLNKKIIIFIDELDRCHPMYTIKTLEVIKHFFGIPNITFVLSVDKTQIENSVRTIYGINQGEENGYLRKFIDVDFQLPQVSTKQFVFFHLTLIWGKINYFIRENRYYNYQMKRKTDSFGYEKEIDILSEQDFLSTLISNCVDRLNFTPRDIEKFFFRFELVLDSLKRNDVLLIEPCILLNIISIYSAIDLDKYIGNGVNDVFSESLPNWKCLFHTYKEVIITANRTGITSANTPMNNVLHLQKFLCANGINNMTIQEEYLKDYLMKIKFIENFNPIN